jgi:uncharacterized protein YebE (UPF0316 family)
VENIFQTYPLVLPIFIFFARIMDVTLGTLRIISLSRGWKQLAPLLGFVEVFIWVVAISQLVRNLTHFSSYLAYAAGFAAGNYIGMWIEEKMALGTFTVRIFAVYEGEELSKRLAEAGFGVTVLDGRGAGGPVKVLFTIIHRRELEQVEEIIHAVNPKMFYSVEEVRAANQGVFHPNRRRQFIKKFTLIKKK